MTYILPKHFNEREHEIKMILSNDSKPKMMCLKSLFC